MEKTKQMENKSIKTGEKNETHDGKEKGPEEG